MLNSLDLIQEFRFLFYSTSSLGLEENRVKKIKKYIDKLFVILPLKRTILKQGIEVSYNGHPLVEHIERFINEEAISKEEFYSKYELDHKKKI